MTTITIPIEIIGIIGGLFLVVVSVLAIIKLGGRENTATIIQSGPGNGNRKHLALQKAELYSQHIIPKIRDVRAALKSEGVARYDGHINALFSESKDHILKKIGTISPATMGAVVSTLQSLEALSAFYSTGLADKKLGFSVIGFSYVPYIKEFYPYICLARSVDSRVYHHIVHLFNDWQAEINEERNPIADDIAENTKEDANAFSKLADLLFKKRAAA